MCCKSCIDIVGFTTHIESTTESKLTTALVKFIMLEQHTSTEPLGPVQCCSVSSS